MKRVFILSLSIFLAFIGTTLLLAKTQEFLFVEKTLDEVWNAALKTLLMNKYSTTEVDKAAYVITAKKRPGLGTQILSEGPAESFTVSLLFTQVEKGIEVTISCAVESDPLAANKKQIKKLISSMAEQLYGKDWEGKVTEKIKKAD
jgi:hypothetical protein